jgi:hypothetical protein
VFVVATLLSLMRIFPQGKFSQRGWEICYTSCKVTVTFKVTVTCYSHCLKMINTIVDGHGGIIFSMLPDLRLNDLLRLRKPHPCGSYEWTVIRLGADIGLECKGCQHRVMLTRRELAKRMKANLTSRNTDEQKKTGE